MKFSICTSAKWGSEERELVYEVETRTENTRRVALTLEEGNLVYVQCQLGTKGFGATQIRSLKGA